MLEDGINLTTRPSDWFERTCGIRMWAHISALRSILKGLRGQRGEIGSQWRRTQYEIVSASVLFQKETQSMCTWLRTRFLNDEVSTLFYMTEPISGIPWIAPVVFDCSYSHRSRESIPMGRTPCLLPCTDNCRRACRAEVPRVKDPSCSDPLHIDSLCVSSLPRIRR